MKKFMRIALVFALAGATLMYTGCTKDYSGDISDLNKKVSENATAISALQTQVAAAQTSANDALASAQNALKEAQEAAKAAAAANNDAEVAALTAKVATIEGQIADLEAKVEALDGLEAKLNEVAEQLKKDVDAKVDAALEEIRAEVAALIESVGVTDFKIVSPNNLKVVYGQFNGVFSGLQAVEWDGPRAEEVAALEKGSYISSSNVDLLEIQVNPVNADLSDVDFDLEDQDGNVAPIDFYPATAYEDLKAASGVWYLPFTVGEITNEFVKRESGNNPIWNKLDKKASLVYDNAIRSNYVPITFEKANKGLFSEFKWRHPWAGHTTFVVQQLAGGEFTLVAEDPEYVFDAFITKTVGHEYEVAKYNVKFDGLTVTYDVDAVNKYFTAHPDGAITLKFQIKQLNVNGYVKEDTGSNGLEINIVNLNIDAPATKHEAVISTTATHEATPLLTNAAGHDAQVVTIDLAEAAKAWGIEAGSAARAIWEEEFFKDGALTPEVVDAIFYPSADNSIVGDATALFSGVAFDVKDHKWNGKATVTFKPNYPNIKYLPSDATSETDFEYVDPIGEVVELTFKLANATDEYIVTVPVQVTAPTAESIASWYNVSEITKYYANAAAAQNETIDLSTAFSVTKAFSEGVTTSGISLAFNTKEVKLADGTKETWTATQVKGTDALAAGKTYTNLGAYVGNLDKLYFYGKNGNTPAHFRVRAGAWKNGTEFHFVGSKSASFVVENLFVKAMNRLYPMSEINVNIIVRDDAPSITLSKALELKSLIGSFEVLTNSLFEPFNQPNDFYGSFTLTDAAGKAMYIKRATEGITYTPIKNVQTFTKSGNDWNPTPTPTRLINVTEQVYECNFGTELDTYIQNAYGLKVTANQDLGSYYGQQIKVEFTFDGDDENGSLRYVATNANVVNDVTVSFIVTIK